MCFLAPLVVSASTTRAATDISYFQASADSPYTTPCFDPYVPTSHIAFFKVARRYCHRYKLS